MHPIGLRLVFCVYPHKIHPWGRFQHVEAVCRHAGEHGLEMFFRNLVLEPAVNFQLSHEKNLTTFHYTGWLIGILVMVYNPYITG